MQLIVSSSTIYFLKQILPTLLLKLELNNDDANKCVPKWTEKCPQGTNSTQTIDNSGMLRVGEIVFPREENIYIVSVCVYLQRNICLSLYEYACNNNEVTERLKFERKERVCMGEFGRRKGKGNCKCNYIIISKIVMHFKIYVFITVIGLVLFCLFLNI